MLSMRPRHGQVWAITGGLAGRIPDGEALLARKKDGSMETAARAVASSTAANATLTSFELIKSRGEADSAATNCQHAGQGPYGPGRHDLARKEVCNGLTRRCRMPWPTFRHPAATG